jgi:hypothetical protein
MGRTNYAELLYSQPSMLEGFARVLDVGGLFDCYNESDDADQMAILADWYGSLSDLQQAIQRYSSNTGIIPSSNDAGTR